MPFQVYDPETLRLLGAVLDAALREVGAGPTEPMLAAKRTATISALAKHLLAAANTGERDPGKLKVLALKGLRSPPADVEVVGCR